jgi:PAS domain S-box-containing protein
VSSRIPDSAEHILSTCSSIRSAAALSTVELGHHRALVDSDTRLIRALQFSQQNFTISDPSLPDNPIVYASEGFLKLTGYTSGEVLGRNCRFLQGPGTDPAAVDIIRKGITNGDDTSVYLLNYRKDGTPFWNQFFVAVLRDSDGNIVNFVGVQCEVPDANMEDELKERVRTINFEDYDEDGECRRAGGRVGLGVVVCRAHGWLRVFDARWALGRSPLAAPLFLIVPLLLSTRAG